MKSAGPLTTETTTSKDGTAIAYEKAGVGPALILIDAAGHYRRFSSFDGLRALLTADFTVYQFDRRGRCQSGDTAPFAPEREVEDLAALINVAGGSAFVYAFSSVAWSPCRPPGTDCRSQEWPCSSRRWQPTRTEPRSGPLPQGWLS
jgi:hypothetical protein